MRVVLGLLSCVAIFAQTPSASEQASALDAIRSYARSYTKSLPDYIATETTRRDVKPVRRGIYLPSVRPQTDTVEEEIRYAGQREMHKAVRVNGQAIASGQADDGTFSRGEFGALLATIFDPASGAMFRWNRVATIGKRRVYVFDFRVPDRPAGYSILEDGGATVVSFRGSVYADVESKAVVRIQMVCTGIPSSSAYQELALSVDYAPAEIAGREFILPMHYTLNATRVDAYLTLEGSYKDYRRFAANSKILVEGERP